MVMKIAIFTDIYAPWGDGGIPSSIKAQKNELERLGHEVVVFCPGYNAREKGVINVPSHEHVEINGAILSMRPEKVEQFVMERFPNFPSEFDLVHVHYEASCSLAGVRLARRFGMPLVQTMHGREDRAIEVNTPPLVRNFVARWLNKHHRNYLSHDIKVKRDKFQAPTKLRARMWSLMVNHAEQADVVVTPSKHFGDKLEHYGVTKPVKVVSNGIDEDLVKQKFQVRNFKDGDVLKMIWNSRISREKRMLEFLEALRRLNRPYLLYAYGNGNSVKHAKKFVKKHNLKVKFYGHVARQKIIERMSECHLAIMASYNFDTQGMTLLEAEATGLPVMFCDPSMEEVVPQGGYVISGSPEPEAMAMALNNIDGAKISEMSKVMLEHRHEVMENVQIEKMLAAYELALSKRPSL